MYLIKGMPRSGTSITTQTVGMLLGGVDHIIYKDTDSRKYNKNGLFEPHGMMKEVLANPGLRGPDKCMKYMRMGDLPEQLEGSKIIYTLRRVDQVIESGKRVFKRNGSISPMVCFRWLRNLIASCEAAMSDEPSIVVPLESLTSSSELCQFVGADFATLESLDIFDSEKIRLASVPGSGIFEDIYALARGGEYASSLELARSVTIGDMNMTVA